LALVYFVWRRRDLVFRSVFILFGIFILACGTTHLMAVWTLWNPDYGVDGAIKVITALASVGTAIFLLRVMPQALAVPSLAQWRAANLALEAEIRERQEAEDGVRRLNSELEDRVRARTADLEEANRRLAAGLAEKETLLQEVHHRVKNNLQVMSGLLTIQARSAPPEFAEHFRATLRRIQTMARVHEQLYNAAQMAKFDLGEYLDALCRSVGELYGASDSKVKCHLRTGSFTVDSAAAVPLVLIVNEVLSNAFKHGFAGRESGEVFIHTEEQDGKVILRITDNGVGLPPDYAERSRRSMGMRLVHSLAKQIGAAVRFAEGAGTTFTLTLPRPSVAAVTHA
jgi:two-component sensor histidine kinase